MDLSKTANKGLYLRLRALKQVPVRSTPRRLPVAEPMEGEIDTSMFEAKELEDINNGIDEFLKQLKEQDSEMMRAKLLKAPLKRFILLPLIILIFSIASLFIIGNVYIDRAGSRGTGWITALFAVRAARQETAASSFAARELIAGIRDENEARIVGLFVDLINVESAERAPSADTAEPEEVSAEVVERKQEISQQIETAQSDVDFEALQEQSKDFSELQNDFQALSGQYNRANLQGDQYTSIISQISTALDNSNFRQVNFFLSQLEGFLRNPAIRANPLLQDLLKTGPVFAESVRLYIATVQELESVQQSRTAAAVEDVQQSQASIVAEPIEESEPEQQNQAPIVIDPDPALVEEVSGLRTRLGSLESDNSRLQTVAGDLSQDNQQLEAQSIELRFQVDELSKEIRRIRNER